MCARIPPRGIPSERKKAPISSHVNNVTAFSCCFLRVFCDRRSLTTMTVDFPMCSKGGGEGKRGEERKVCALLFAKDRPELRSSLARLE